MVIIATSFKDGDSWSVKPENSALILDGQDAYDLAKKHNKNIDVIFVVDDYGRCKEYNEHHGDFESEGECG